MHWNFFTPIYNALMHAFLITGGTQEERDKHVEDLLAGEHIVEIDQIRLYPDEGGAVTVESVRTFLKQLLLSPRQSPKTAGIVPNADSMTVQSQNALLKTLEEPPPHSILILHTANAATMLSTILSRCIHISLQPHAEVKEDEAFTRELLSLPSLSVGKRMNAVDSITGTREETSIWIDRAIRALHTTLIEHSDSTTTHSGTVRMIRSLMRAQRKLLLNISAKTVIDAVVLNFENEDTIAFPE